MSETITYEVHMRLNGRVTQLPDSQKLFGTLIYLYAEQRSQEEASELVAAVKSGQLRFSLSNLMPCGYIPVPKRYVLAQLAKLDLENRGKQEYKELRKRDFIKQQCLSELMDNPRSVVDLYPYVRLEEKQEIHAAIDSLTYQLPGLDPNLYSVPEIMIKEIKQGESGHQLKEFYFYMELEQKQMGKQFMQVLGEALEQERLFFLGPRVSQGLNLYQMTGYKETEEFSAPASYYLNLGMLLPNYIDFGKSIMDISTSVRLPYKQRDGWSKDFKKWYISYIDAGSIIYPAGNRDEAGKVIDSIYDKRAVVFGNAMLYPLEFLN